MVKDINNNWSYILNIYLTEGKAVSDEQAINILENELNVDRNSIVIEGNEIYGLLNEEIPCRNCEEE